MYLIIQALDSGAANQNLRKRENTEFAMKMRRSPLFRLWVGLLVSLFVSGVVSPALVWCHESDGGINVELGRCGNVLPSQAASESSFLKSVEPGCDSCSDTAIFIVGPNQSLLYDPASPVVQMAAIVAFHSLTDSDLLPVFEVSPALYEINPSLASIRSTVLLI